jgi:histidinol-phosphatase (PHP family)
VYLDALSLIAEAAGTGLFDVMGHIDHVKKFGHPPRDGEAVAAAATRALRAIAAAGAALELNTAGWRKPVDEAYPSAALLAEAAGLGIPLTFGSDAHRPEQVGAEFGRAATLAKAAGYRAVTRLAGAVPSEDLL